MGNSGEGEEGVEFGDGWQMDRWDEDDMRSEVRGLGVQIWWLANSMDGSMDGSRLHC